MKAHTGVYTALTAVLAIFLSDVLDPRTAPARVRFSTHAAAATVEPVADDGSLASRIAIRHGQDVAALKVFRPGYEFWRSIFSIPDGSIVFGSAVDGRPLAQFPARGDWQLDGVWSDSTLAALVRDLELPSSLDDRRDYVAQVLHGTIGPVLHNPTRGGFVSSGLERYGRFLQEWGAIYERFGVPAEIGLAQALIESGFEGTRRSEAGAIGLCQWLGRNWKYLDRLDPAVLEPYNQTTQAAYCAAYLTVLATKYGSFIPALSEHHAGGTNVGRMLINGERLGAGDVRERYFRAGDFVRDLRTYTHPRYSDIYGTYGPRSYFYAEMVFGNAARVRSSMDTIEQRKVYAMRTSRAIRLNEIARRTGLSTDNIRRYNPALNKSVPAGATLYLPQYVSAFGRNVAFWHQPASATFAATLNDFVRLEATPEEWESPQFEPTLAEFERRFRATRTEEGGIMATVIAYVTDETSTSGRRKILSEFRTSDYIRDLFDRAVQERAE